MGSLRDGAQGTGVSKAIWRPKAATSEAAPTRGVKDRRSIRILHRVLRLKTRGIPENMVCSILVRICFVLLAQNSSGQAVRCPERDERADRSRFCRHKSSSGIQRTPKKAQRAIVFLHTLGVQVITEPRTSKP